MVRVKSNARLTYVCFQVTVTNLATIVVDFDRYLYANLQLYWRFQKKNRRKKIGELIVILVLAAVVN